MANANPPQIKHPGARIQVVIQFGCQTSLPFVLRQSSLSMPFDYSCIRRILLECRQLFLSSPQAGNRWCHHPYPFPGRSAIINQWGNLQSTSSFKALSFSRGIRKVGVYDDSFCLSPSDYLKPALKPIDSQINRQVNQQSGG